MSPSLSSCPAGGLSERQEQAWLPDEMKMERLREKVLSTREIPTIPPVLVKVLAVINNQTTSAHDLARAIECDQALTARILWLANSAFFGFSRSISNPLRAVTMLGFSAVKHLALGVKIWQALTEGAARHMRTENLWMHSLTVAAAARALAMRFRAPDPGEAFTAGLLHDVGKIGLCLCLPAEYTALCNGVLTADPLAHEREREALGTDHAETGGWLAEAWCLPEGIVAAVAGHHASVTRGPRQDTPGIVALADHVACWSGDGASRLPSDLDPTGLDPAQWDELFEQVRAERDTLAGLWSHGR